MSVSVSRRGWLGSCLLAGVGSAAPALPPQARDAEYKTYFGDLHNHNNVGYAQGSLRRAYENARNGLSTSL